MYSCTIKRKKSKKDIIGLGICLVVLGVLDIANPYISSKAIEVFFGDNPDFSKTWLFFTPTLSPSTTTSLWYEIVFPFGKISSNFICQKNLIFKGSLEEFEDLFNGKIVKRR